VAAPLAATASSSSREEPSQPRAAGPLTTQRQRQLQRHHAIIRPPPCRSPPTAELSHSPPAFLASSSRPSPPISAPRPSPHHPPTSFCTRHPRVDIRRMTDAYDAALRNFIYIFRRHRRKRRYNAANRICYSPSKTVFIHTNGHPQNQAGVFQFNTLPQKKLVRKKKTTWGLKAALWLSKCFSCSFLYNLLCTSRSTFTRLASAVL
jgi:hypothetical protein